MFIWFTMLLVLGVSQIIHHPGIIKALNPIYGYELLTQYPKGFWLLGAVFLCTTGAEALYSDLGHCGKCNIRNSCIFVKTCLILNYLGQGAWLLAQYKGQVIPAEVMADGFNPFISIMPQWFKLFGIAIATAAAIIASQALISGSFTLISEAMRLNLWPKMKINYPTEEKGQLYIPGISLLLFVGCVGITLYFQKSANMGAAYGLAITLCMISTSILFANFLVSKRTLPVWIYLYLAVYLLIETSFLIANLEKFMHGGYVTLIVGGGLFAVMYVWFRSRKIKNRYVEFVHLEDYIPMIQELSNDKSIPKYATHLVYMTSANNHKEIEHKIIYSILNKKPKRADIYWFVHVDISNEPFGASYAVEAVVPRRIFFVRLNFGFKVDHKVNLMFNKIVEEMVKNGEVDELSHYPSLRKYNMPADFKFILLNSRVAIDDALTPFEQFVVKGYRFIKSISLSTAEDFGLELTNVEEETVPITIAPSSKIELQRVK